MLSHGLVTHFRYQKTLHKLSVDIEEQIFYSIQRKLILEKISIEIHKLLIFQKHIMNLMGFDKAYSRLFGFRDGFPQVVSDTQAYKQFGNSVAVPVFKEVARIMKPHIQEILTRDTAYQKAG